MWSECINLREFINDSTTQDVLSLIPHKIEDEFGNILSKNLKPDVELGESREVKLGEKGILKVEARSVEIDRIEAFLSMELAFYLQLNKLKAEYEELEILDKDLREVFNVFSYTSDFNKAVRIFLNFLQCQVCASYAAFYLIEDNSFQEIHRSDLASKSLASLFQVNEDPLICFSATKGKVFIYPADESRPIDFKEKAQIVENIYGEDDVPQNLMVIPIFSDREVFGILFLKDAKLGIDSRISKYFIDNATARFSMVFRQFLYDKELKQQQSTIEMLEKYLDKSVFRHIRKAPGVATISQRKHVVVAFIAIDDFDNIMHSISPKKMIKLLNYHYALMSSIIEKHGGTIDKIIGHVLMVLWNHPEPIADPEIIAVQAAQEMQNSVGLEREVWEVSGVNNFSLKIGINAGDAVVGDLGGSGFKDYTVIGDIINTAQRLESFSPPGDIIVHEEVKKNVASLLVPTKTFENVELKGKAGPLTVYSFKDSLKVETSA